MSRSIKNIFVQGAIDPTFIASSIAKHASKTDIGAHSIFLGQIRADEINGRKVTCIEYIAYEDMVLTQMAAIREELFAKYELTCMHVYHSLGKVAVGEICLFVFTSSAHRQAATEACAELVERIKKELPIWGKEWLESNDFLWKKDNGSW